MARIDVGWAMGTKRSESLVKFGRAPVFLHFSPHIPCTTASSIQSPNPVHQGSRRRYCPSWQCVGSGAACTSLPRRRSVGKRLKVETQVKERKRATKTYARRGTDGLGLQLGQQQLLDRRKEGDVVEPRIDAVQEYCRIRITAVRSSRVHRLLCSQTRKGGASAKLSRLPWLKTNLFVLLRHSRNDICQLGRRTHAVLAAQALLQAVRRERERGEVRGPRAW